MDRLAAMEAFVRVVETGSFSAAARLLNVGQPAVSKTVAQLEERLGVRLLMRSTRGLSPTEAGQSFYDRARRAIEEVDGAELAARGAGASLTGRLRISAAVTFARLHVVPHLPKFLAAHPGLTMDVILDDRVIDLVEEGVDVALRMGSLRNSSSLTARRLASAPHYVVGTPPTSLERGYRRRQPSSSRIRRSSMHRKAIPGASARVRQRCPSTCRVLCASARPRACAPPSWRIWGWRSPRPGCSARSSPRAR